MKLTNMIINASMVLSISMLAISCTKDTIQKEAGFEVAGVSNKAFVQLINLTIGSTRNYIYVDGVPVNGSSLAYLSTFPAAPSPNFAVEPGFRAFLIRDTLAATTQPAMSLAENLQPGGNYTLFTYDTVNAVKNKLVVNNIIFPSDTTSRLRFANFAYSPNAIPAVDVFSKRLNANVFTNVSVNDVTAFIPYDSRRADTLIIREAGSGVDLQNRTVAGTPPVTTFSPVQLIIGLTRKRSYTLVFRGSYRADLTTAATVRSLSLYANN